MVERTLVPVIGGFPVEAGGISRGPLVNSPSTKTLSSIDTSRGIAMLAVIVTHVNQIPRMFYLQAFMLPLFAMLSGYLLPEETPAWKPFLAKKIRRLLAPYFIIASASLFYWLAFLNHFTVFSDFHQPVSIMVLGIVKGSDLVFNGPLWYLFALFLAFVWWRISARYGRYSVITGLVFYGCGYTLSQILDAHRLFASLPLSLFLAGYLHTGRFLRKQQAVINRAPIGVLFAVFIVAATINGTVNFYGMNLGNPFLFLIGSVSGSLTAVRLSMTLENIPTLPVSRLLSYVGKHSMALLCYHWPLLLTLNALLSAWGVFDHLGGTFSLVYYHLPQRMDIPSLLVRAAVFVLYFSWSVGGSLAIERFAHNRRAAIRISMGR